MTPNTQQLKLLWVFCCILSGQLSVFVYAGAVSPKPSRAAAAAGGGWAGRSKTRHGTNSNKGDSSPIDKNDDSAPAVNQRKDVNSKTKNFDNENNEEAREGGTGAGYASDDSIAEGVAMDELDSDRDEPELRRMPSVSKLENFRNPILQLDVQRCATPVVDFIRRTGFRKAGKRTESRICSEVRGSTKSSGVWHTETEKKCLPKSLRLTMLEVARAMASKMSSSKCNFEQAFDRTLGKHLAAKTIEVAYLLRAFEAEQRWFSKKCFVSRFR